MARGFRNSSLRISPGVVGSRWSFIYVVLSKLVVIRHSHSRGAFCRPLKDHPPLIVDPDAVATIELSLEGLQSIARRTPEIGQLERVVKHVELSLDDPSKRCPP